MTDTRRAKPVLASLATLALVAAMLTAGSPAMGADPKTAQNRDWITIAGTVVATTPSSFRLDYGSGVISVEMDDWDWYKEGRNLLQNDRVIVYGRIDQDAFETRKVEAASVYVGNLGTYFHANSTDEEDLGLWTLSSPHRAGALELTGKVASIDGREVTLSSGVKVDTAELGYNPLDDKGYQRIDVGDRIKVAGHVDDDLFEKAELMADWIVNLDGMRASS
jgi:uncharacterized protein YdeI (BOF family)